MESVTPPVFWSEPTASRASARRAGFAGRVALAGILFATSLQGGCASRSATEAASGVELFPRPFQIIGHRGTAWYAPENTLAAFRKARELGAVEVELDAQLTRDDQVVLFHDETLATKTGNPGRVRDLTLAELTRLDIGAWFDAARSKPQDELQIESPHAPRFAGTHLDPLASLFAEMGRALFYHVELKDEEPGLAAAVLRLIDRFELRDRVMITSFHFEQVLRMQALAPALPTCFLIDHAGGRRESIEHEILRAARAGFSEVGVAAQEITPAQVALAHGHGLWIRAWRVRSDEDMERAIRAGSNGMTIDRPERLIRRLLEHEGSAGTLLLR